ncbi:MAG: 4-hydroxy-tetrahydrodipicolinate synthase [Clostridia bacterium]|nr:4-hydroxy-tetrahydrodipicolinate synthase [Clostridia bacterium]
MNIKNLKGSIVALVTPFNMDGSVNFEKLGELIEFHIENKTDAILVLGTTGESSTMTHEEDEAVCKFTVDKVAGRVPVIAGSGSNCTQTMIEKSVAYEKLGADGLLIISPYYNKTNDEGMYQHFKMVADAVNIPCIIYNVPGRTGCSISENVVARLKDHPNIMGIKEASGNMSYAMKIAKHVSEDFVMYSGNDDIAVPIMAIGGSGVISVSANCIPKETHDMIFDFINGDVAKANEAQLKYLDFINALFIEVNPIPVKEALNLMGMNVGGYRFPLTYMSEANKEKLAQTMKNINLI